MKHQPDHEMEIIRRGMRDLAELSFAGRQRVLAYWTARIEALPGRADGKDCGEQQLDIEERMPVGRATPDA